MGDIIMDRDTLLSLLPAPVVKKVYSEQLKRNICIITMTAMAQQSLNQELTEFYVEKDEETGQEVQKFRVLTKSIICKRLVRCLCNEKGVRLFQDSDDVVLEMYDANIINHLDELVRGVLETEQPMETDLKK